MKTNFIYSKNKLLILIGFLTLTLLVVTGCHDSEIEQNPASKIIIEVEPSKEFIKNNSRELIFCPINQIGNLTQYKSVEAKVSKRKASWVFYSKEPIMIRSSLGVFRLLNPGDSIIIKPSKNGFVFLGRGAEKIAICHEVREAEKKLAQPTKNSLKIDSLADYFNWNLYVDSLLALQISILDLHKDKISKVEYDFLKSVIVEAAENNRINAFMALMSNNNSKKTNYSLTGIELSAIWDSTQHRSWSNWLRSLPNYQGPINAQYALNKGEVYRKFSFNLSNDSLNSKEIRTYLYYLTAKSNYEGLTRERLLMYILDEPTIKEMGVKNPMTQSMLKDYYSLPGFPEYKAKVKELENENSAR